MSSLLPPRPTFAIQAPAVCLPGGWGGTSLAAATGLGGLAVVMMLSVSDALAGIVGLALGHLAMRGLYEKRLEGHTGDTQGAVNSGVNWVSIRGS